MNDPKRHAQQRNLLESVARYIPGFRGYLEKEYRRESDHLTRTALADRLQQGQRALDNYMRSLVDASQLDRLPALERVKTRLEGLILKLRGAVRGYSGFFDYVRVNTQLLDQVYEHDRSLLGDVEELGRLCDQLTGKLELADRMAHELLQRIEDLDRKFAKRGEMLQGLGS